MTFLTRPFFTFIFAVAPFWLPLLIVDVAALLVLLFAERFRPRTFIFWVAVVIVFPFGGLLLYLAFGSTLYGRWMYGRKAENDRRFLGPATEAVPEDYADWAKSIRGTGGDLCIGGNSAEFHWSREDVRDRMADDIRSAVKTVYIMARCMPGFLDDVYDAVLEKTRQGVEVRIMTSVRGFGRTAGVRKLKEAGARVCTFHSTWNSMFSIRPAYRNMRAAVIIDGCVAYEGRGAILRVEGPAADRIERRFRADWFHGSGEDLGVPAAVPSTAGGVCVQTVSDGPDVRMSPMMACYTQIIEGTRDRLYMVFPYLLPNDEMYSAVKLAVASGVDVRILLPRRGRHWWQSWNSLAASNPLMTIGAKVYFADRTLGKCVMVSDGAVCCTGSADFSGVSLEHDFNMSCLVYSRDVASRAEADFMDELGRSVECLPEEYSHRSLTDMFLIAVARMLMFFN